jgi:hypothetical protein
MIALWLFFRALRWLAWIAFFGTAFYCMAYRPMTQFGHLQFQFEVALMALGNVCIFMGFFELMAREKAGLARPDIGQLIPPPASP